MYHVIVFPYTKDAWLESSNSKDTIALTAIVSATNQLSKPAYTERYGFALSNPITFAGKLTRSTAALRINNRVERNLYTPEEMSLLENIDEEIARLSSGKGSRPVSKNQLKRNAAAMEGTTSITSFSQ